MPGFWDWEVDVSFGRPPFSTPGATVLGWQSGPRSMTVQPPSSGLPGACCPGDKGPSLPMGQGVRNWSAETGVAGTRGRGGVQLSSEHLHHKGPETPPLRAMGTGTGDPRSHHCGPPMCHTLLALSKTDLLRAIRGIFISCLCLCLKCNLPEGSLGVPGAVPGPQVIGEAWWEWLTPRSSGEVGPTMRSS